MATFKDLEDSLKSFITEEQSDAHNIRNTTFTKYNNIKIWMDRGRFQEPHFIVRISISEGVYFLTRQISSLFLRVLTNCLKELEEDGLVVREEYEGLPPKVEYYLTDIGYTLRPVIDSMQKWGKEYKRLRKLMERTGCSLD